MHCKETFILFRFQNIYDDIPYLRNRSREEVGVREGKGGDNKLLLLLLFTYYIFKIPGIPNSIQQQQQ